MFYVQSFFTSPTIADWISGAHEPWYSRCVNTGSSLRKEINAAAWTIPRMHRDKIRSQQRIEHPCLVRLHNVIESDGIVNMFMGYPKYGNLDEFRKGINGPIRLHEAFVKELARQILEGLDYLYHFTTNLEIKPSNILMFDDQPLDFKLMDLGISKEGFHASVTCRPPKPVPNI